MTRLPRSSRTWREAGWVAGALATLCLYGLRSFTPPRRTDAGVERRMWAAGHTPPRLREAPGGGRWLVALTPHDASAPGAIPAAPSPLAWPLPTEGLWRSLVRPPFRPLATSGTWLMEGRALRYAFAYPSGWVTDHALVADGNAGLGPSEETPLLGLTDGRIYRGPDMIAWARAHGVPRPENLQYGMYELVAEEQERPASLSPGLEDLPTGTIGTVFPGARGPGFAGSDSASGGLYALEYSNDGEFRYRWAGSGGIPIAQSRDGRTAYLERGGYLWRLDLRRPLPELLDAPLQPSLDDPSE